MDQLHFIHSRDGRLGLSGVSTTQDVDQIVSSFRASQLRHLVLHFHGGLVSAQKGLEIAERLLPLYQGAGSYPIFVVWESDWWETLRNNFGELAGEPVVRALFRNVVEFALRQLGSSAGGLKSGEIDHHEGFAPRRLPSTVVSTPFSQSELESELRKDPELVQALETLWSPPEPHFRTRFLAPPTPGFVDWAAVVAYVAQVLVAVVQRFLSGRDHGLHATCVEEMLRGFTVAGSTGSQWAQALTWNRMKQDAPDAFEPDPEVYACTALLSRLKVAIEDGLSLDRITLVGHSAGTIFVANWLEHQADWLPPRLAPDVVFLAPAVSFERFSATLQNPKVHIKGFRLFGMRDERERADQLIGTDDEIPSGQNAWRFVYPSSLLYLVSGVLESSTRQNGSLVDEPDMPLLGLERHHNDLKVYPDNDFPDIARVRNWLRQKARPVVWSPSVGKGPGLNSDCTDHGSFDHEKHTMESLAHLIQYGFE